MLKFIIKLKSGDEFSIHDNTQNLSEILRVLEDKTTDYFCIGDQVAVRKTEVVSVLSAGVKR
jgi:hypothetical protein